MTKDQRLKQRIAAAMKKRSTMNKSDMVVTLQPMQLEANLLQNYILRIEKFIYLNPAFDQLSHQEQSDLMEQMNCMKAYGMILEKRINKMMD